MVHLHIFGWPNESRLTSPILLMGLSLIVHFYLNPIFLG
ncbi:hypothetical protein NT05LI_2525, partial [Listeria ivanovii FSL F6-596]